MSKITGKWRVVFDTYLVSDDGQVYSTRSHAVLKATLNKATGYYVVSLGRGNKQYVHRLVALAFFGPVTGNDVVDHIDGNRTNNNVSNLRYISKQQNDAQGSVSMCKYYGSIPEIYSLRGTESAEVVAKRYGIPSATTVRNIWAGKTWRNITQRRQR